MSVASRRLGRTEQRVSEIGLGGAWLRGPSHDGSIEEGQALVRAALDRGVTYVDTAECYLGGVSERIVGPAVAGRDGVVVSTKFGHVPDGFDFGSEAVLASVAASLERLGLDGVDVLFLHAPPEPAWETVVAPGGTLDGMREAQSRGWTGHLAVSGYDLAFLDRAVASDAFDVLLVFGVYDLLVRTGAGLLARAAEHDMGVVVGSPLRGGLLTPARRQLFEVDVVDGALLEFFAGVESVFAGTPGGAVGGALRFLLDTPLVSTVLIGGAAVTDVEQALLVAGHGLTDAERDAVDELHERLRERRR